MAEAEKPNIEDNLFKRYKWVIISVALAWFLVPILFCVATYFKIKPETSGVFGDAFGSINALFSGLAFAAIIITLNLQREELRLQRQELKNQIAELAKQSDELKSTNNEYKVQRFNMMFFSMLENKIKSLNSLAYTPSLGEKSYGKQVITKAHNALRVRESELLEDGEDGFNEVWLSSVISGKFSPFSSFFSEYFQSVNCLFAIFKYTDIDESAKQSYLKLARDSFDSSEIWLLATLGGIEYTKGAIVALKNLDFFEDRDLRLAAMLISPDDSVQSLFHTVLASLHRQEIYTKPEKFEDEI